MNLRTLNAMLLSIGLGALILGCGSAEGESGAGSGQACKLSGDCPGGEVCIRVGDASTCALDCTASADACGGSASCEGVGQVSVNVCTEEKPATGEAAKPEETPRLPCASDMECSAFQAGAVCAQWKGARDCTIQCTSDDVCNPPAAGGLRTEFFSCQPDEGDTSRTACLPREECFNDPSSCITFDGGSSGSGFPSGGGL